MIFFILLLLPVSLFLYYSFTQKKQYLFMTLAAFFVGIIACGVRFIFFYSHRLVPDSFIQNFFFYFTRVTFLPLLVYGLFVLVTKDSWEFKLDGFFPIMAAFNSVYYPYYFLTMLGSVYSGYDLFFRPVIYLAMLAGVSMSIKMIYAAFKNNDSNAKVKSIAITAGYLIFPSLVDTAYAMNAVFWLFVILSVAYIASVGVFAYLKRK